MKTKDLNKVFALLEKEGPAFTVSPERQDILMQWDALLGEACSETTAVLGNFYRKRGRNCFEKIFAY